jgi:ankyrin repeat protein
MLGAYHGHGEVVRVLLEHGADAEAANDGGQTPLAAAAYQGYTGMVELLLDLGADVNGTGRTGVTALMTAAMFDRGCTAPAEAINEDIVSFLDIANFGETARKASR